MRFKTSFLITLLFHLSLLVIDKAAGFVIVKLLEDAPDKVGGVQLLMHLPPIMIALSNLGLAASIVYFAKRKEVSLAVAAGTTSSVAIVWGFFVALVAFCAFALWSWLHPAAALPDWALLLPMLLLAPFSILTVYRNCIQLVENRIVGYNFVHLLPGLAYLPCFLGIYYFLTKQDPYYAAVYARFVPGVFLALGLIWHLRKLVPMRPSFDAAFFKKAIRFGWRANIHATLTILNHRIDIYIVAALYTVSAALPEVEQLRIIKEEAAFYSLAVTLAELIWHFPEAMRDLIFAKVASLDEREAREFTPVVVRNSLAICSLGAIAVWFVHEPFLGLWLGGAWETHWAAHVTPALAWLLPGTVLYTVAKILQSDLMARERVGVCNWLTFLALIVLCTLDLVLVPSMGARGAAIASTVAYLCGAVATVYAYRRSSDVGISRLLFVRLEDWKHYQPILARIRRGGRGAPRS